MPQMMPLMWNIMPLMILFIYLIFCLYAYFHMIMLLLFDSMLNFKSFFEFQW